MSNVKLISIDEFWNIDCNSCKYVNMTELEQREHPRGNMGNHICKKYECRVCHFCKHPKLMPCLQCEQDNYINYIKE